MTKKMINTVLISMITWIAYSQVEMSKQEIYKHEISTSWEINKPDIFRTRFDSAIVKLIDNLKFSGVDTIGAYSEEDVGSYFLDSCQCGNIPWIGYIYWIQNGINYCQRVSCRCMFEAVEIENSVLISYYINAKNQIDNNMIMPVIIRMSKNEKGEILSDIEMVDHTIHYNIYCDLNGHSRFTTFQQYFLENENNLFYKDNQNSVINSWRKMIINQIEEIENK
jgi:hypothetical protein